MPSLVGSEMCIRDRLGTALLTRVAFVAYLVTFLVYFLTPSRLRFWKPCSGNSGDCHVWKLVTDPSPPHSADGSPAANIWPGGFSAARLWKAPLDGPECRGSDDNCSPSALTYHLSLSLSLLSTDYYCLSPCCHTLRRCSLTVRTLCLRREEWDHDPPAVTTRNS